MNKLPESEAEPRSGVASASRQERIVLALWEQSREQLLDEMKILDQAAAALAEGTLNDDLRQKAAAEAHKLIGSFGILKLNEGARLAAALEDLLRGGEIRESGSANFREIISAMRRMMVEGPQKQHHRSQGKP
jgi:HPt (histidine-containing phosphotransfer) domain-containing protein